MSHTIVFVHGLLGFSETRVLGLRIEYFRGIKAVLQAEETPSYFATLPAVGSVIERATALATVLEVQTADTFTIIAHSMGGLDARYLIRHLDPSHRVRCLITIGTPHRGSPVARWMLETRGILPWLGRRYWRSALADLTPEACRVLNETLPDRDDVRYISYAGQRPLHLQPWWLRSFGRMVEGENGANDGLVSLDSARWGEFRGIVHADHLELAGWSLARRDPKNARPFAHVDFYRRLVHKTLETDTPPRSLAANTVS